MTILNAIAEVTTGGFAAALDGIFRAMEIAEEEIAAARRRHPEKAAILWDCFMLLNRPPLFRNLHPAIYRHHCRELLERVVAGEDTRYATDAELLVALCRASLKAPLMDTAEVLYVRLFQRIFPDQDIEDADQWVREPYPGAADQLATRMRCQFGNPDRVTPKRGGDGNA